MMKFVSFRLDSGGGLYMREPALTATLGNNLTVFYVAGIVSYGEGCARKDKPGIIEGSFSILIYI